VYKHLICATFYYNCACAIYEAINDDKMTNSRINIRLDQKKKDRFMRKATAEFGSGTRCLKKFIEAYSKDSFYISDDAVNLLLISVQGLHTYLNNLNQVAKKLNSTGELDDRFTPEFVEHIHTEIANVIVAFKSVVEIDTDRIKDLTDVYRVNQYG
jgi:hypothetical protein